MRFRGYEIKAVALLLLAAALVLLPATRGLADDEQLKQWQQQRQSIEGLLATLKPLNTHTVDDVFQIRMESKSLVLRTRLPTSPDGGFERASLDGINGGVMVTVQRRADDPAGAVTRLPMDAPMLRWFAQGLIGVADVPETLNLSISDFSTPKQRRTIAISSQQQPAAALTISKTIQFLDNRLHMVQITQMRGPQSNGVGMFQLMISDVTSPGAAPEQLNFDAPDFFTFVREHPREAEQYVRPMLREIGQEAVFAPEELLAWQVFSDLWKPDPLATRRVKALLSGLDAEDYRVRDATLRQLARLGRDGAAVMLHMDRSHLTPEQNLRIDRALAPYAQLSLREVLHLRSDSSFLLDCLYSDESALRRAALDRLRLVARPDIRFDVNGDPVARAAAVAVLRQQILRR